MAAGKGYASPAIHRQLLAYGSHPIADQESEALAVMYGRGMNGHTGAGPQIGIVAGAAAQGRKFSGDGGPLQNLGRGRFNLNGMTLRTSLEQAQALPSTNAPAATPSSVKQLLATTPNAGF